MWNLVDNCVRSGLAFEAWKAEKAEWKVGKVVDLEKDKVDESVEPGATSLFWVVGRFCQQVVANCQQRQHHQSL